ncbi:hypothetical protein PHMEG_00010986 [Phytophthora megakarya]|uniref:Uncharacterized protein n=1 Tax=Phytophthora megakarya TaxID=4795 RepID=A0A225WET9_9STRA|nr:hypothetical protein PHMEG_00010986 [Phytophthora megakarya]
MAVNTAQSGRIDAELLCSQHICKRWWNELNVGFKNPAENWMMFDNLITESKLTQPKKQQLHPPSRSDAFVGFHLALLFQSALSFIYGSCGAADMLENNFPLCAYLKAQTCLTDTIRSASVIFGIS